MTPPGINTDRATDLLKDRFICLWKRCLIDGTLGDPDNVWAKLELLYTEPHRHYHDLGHLEHCLQELDAVSARLDHPDQVEMAIWFHDLVHKPGQPDNESQSAELFASMTSGVIAAASTAAIADLIMVTTHDRPPASVDQGYICDIDMSSFGLSWERFLEDSKNLKKESPAPLEEYYSGKQRFYELLLERPRIFYTEHFYRRYEDQARRNIRRTLKLIGEGNREL